MGGFLAGFAPPGSCLRAGRVLHGFLVFYMPMYAVVNVLFPCILRFFLARAGEGGGWGAEALGGN